MIQQTQSIPSKRSNTGEMYICRHINKDTYCVQVDNKAFNKTYTNLADAIVYRNRYLGARRVSGLIQS